MVSSKNSKNKLIKEKTNILLKTIFRESNLCELCLQNGIQKEAEQEHHIEFDPITNKSNKEGPTQMLCTLCHAKIHGIEPRISELRRLVILYGRTQKARIAIQNQIRGLSRIEMIIPIEFSNLIKETERLEKQYSKEIKNLLEGRSHKLRDNQLSAAFPSYSYITSIKGISHLLAGKLISMIDIKRSPTVASLWAYAGQTPDSKRVRGKTLNWNQELKCTCFQIADEFVKKRTPKYREIYDKEKAKQLDLLEKTIRYMKTTSILSSQDHSNETDQIINENHHSFVGSSLPKSRMHCHRRAMRKAVKEFLKDLWVEMKKEKEISIKDKQTQPIPLLVTQRNG